MRYRKLGNSELSVSEICLGSWLTYSGGVEKKRAIACVHRALSLGVNFIDTANIYGRGIAESVLGEALRGVPRDTYVLATKLYFPMTSSDKGLSRAQIEKQLAASLQRLGTDYVDLYQCHRYDSDTPLEETMRALSDAVNSGKVRYIGFSEWPVDKIRAATEMAGVTRFVSSQPQYSLLWRGPEESLIPYCEAHGISQIVWSPLAQGVLTGKYRPHEKVPADSRAASDTMGGFLSKAWLSAPVLNAVLEMQSIAQSQGLTAAQFALAWILRQPNVAAAIIGATRPEQVEENVGASGARIDPSSFAAVEKRFSDALR